MSSIDYTAHFAFIEAVANNNIDEVLAGIEDPDFMNKNPFRWTPLHYTAASENIECSNAIIEKQSDYLNMEDKFHRTPLSIAASQGNSNLMKLLLENGADVNMGLPLCYAAMKRKTECVTSLIDAGCFIDEESDLNGKEKCTPLVIAVKSNNLEVAKLLIDNGANTNFGANVHMTPLHWACQNGSVEIIEALLEKNTELNCRCENDSTPLEYAITYERIDIVKYLLEKGCVVNTVDKFGFTPLHVAVRTNNNEIIKEVLQHGSEIDFQSRDGTTPLLSCFDSETTNEDVFETLVTNGADINISGFNNWTPLHMCCAAGNLGCVKLLLDKELTDGVNAITMENITPLYLAAAYGHINVCKELLENGALINIKINKFPNLTFSPPHMIHSNNIKEGYDAERIAAAKEHHDIVDLINNYKNDHSDTNVEDIEIINYAKENLVTEVIERSSNINDTDLLGWTCLHHAAELGHSEVVKVCIDIIEDINITDKFLRTPLAIAAGSGNIEIVELLIENGADPNLGSAIFHAIENGELECVKYMLDKGADTNVHDRRKQTPLMYAVMKDNSNILEVLLEKLADVSAQDEDGNTALHRACFHNSLDCVSALVNAGADINARNMSQKTPLFLAPGVEELEIMKVLLENGADINAEDESNQTVLHSVARYGSNECVEEILRYSPDLNIRNNDYHTPLSMSLCNDIPDVFKLLIENGADYTVSLPGGWTILHCMALNGDMTCLEEILKYDVDINALTIESISPLHVASNEGHLNFVNKLLEIGCLVDTAVTALNDWQVKPVCLSPPLSPGSTPLIAAVCNGHLEIVRALYYYGASLDTKTETGITAVSCSISFLHFDIFTFLMEQGCQLDELEREQLRNLAEDNPEVKEKIQAYLTNM